MLKAIIFDFDGVIADTFDMSLGVNREVRFVSVKDFKNHHNGNVYEKPVIRFSEKEIEYWRRRYCELANKSHLIPIKKQIDNLAKKYMIFIISSSPEKGVKKYLKLGGISRYFKKIMGRETHKSKAEKFNMLFKKYKVRPEESVFVTDTLGDIREAKKVKVPTIAVAWGYHSKTRLEKGKPDLIIHNFKDLIPAINKLKITL